MTRVSQTQRVYDALRRAGQRGISRLDFEDDPVIDGGPRILRVARCVDDLKNRGVEVVSDPQGGPGRTALYRLRDAAADPAPAQTPRRLSAAPEPAPIGTHGPGGGQWVHRCGGCLANHRPGFRCPHGHQMTRIELYVGPVGEPCRKVNVQEERHAA